jgi:hypothetical protein
MRRAVAALLVVSLALLAGCGGDDGPETGNAEIPDALAYFPPDATSLTLLPTDLGSTQAKRLERLVKPSLDGRTLREALAETIEYEGRIDFARDVEPLLGGTAVVGIVPGVDDDEAFVAALDTGDDERLRGLVGKLGVGDGVEHRGATVFDAVAIDGPTLLVGSEPQALMAAIDRERDDRGASADTIDAALGDEATADALVRSFGTGAALLQLPDVRAAVEDPWIRALRGYGLVVELEQDAIEARARVRTDPDGLRDEDLPLETGSDSPAVGREDGVINAGNRNQSRTTVFLARLARRAFPDSRFVREVEALERDLGIRFEDEVLAQFNGPSASLAAPDGAFAAVSDLADADRMRELLPRLAPRLPAILRGLQGLGNSGLVALLLFAPDAPLVPGALDALSAAIKVVPLGGDDDEELLFRIDGLNESAAGEPAFAGPGQIVFGMIGDRFVVASDERRAREAAEMETEQPDGAEGAAAAWADLSTFDADDIGLETAPLGELVGSLEASTEGLEGRLRIEVPGGLDG